MRNAVTLGSPRTGVIADVHPETSISKQQQTHESGEPIWHAFTQFVKKTSVTDSDTSIFDESGEDHKCFDLSRNQPGLD